MGMQIQGDSGWWQTAVDAGGYVVTGLVAAVSTFFAFVRRADRSDGRLEALEIKEQRHEDDCAERNRKMDEVIAGFSHSNAELQRQIYAVQFAQAQQATRDDIKDIIAAIERRQRGPH